MNHLTHERYPAVLRLPLALVLFVALALLVLRVDAAALITSELDDREYRYLAFDNGLQVMLVSDPQTDKAAASLDVAVGHGSDPEGREGLAHLLEHMLFLGTAKYPSAGEYQEYIKDNGGTHNAYTSYDHTNYFFSLRPEFLQGALDRFSQFFVAPLFNEDLVKRERTIVHSEYSARADEEGRRTLAARRQALNPAHPRSRFAVGSVETLADRDGSSIREELIAFYEQNYSASLMTLAVIGREDLDTLEQWVRELFADVRRTDARRFVAEQPLYDAQTLPSILKVVPLKELREVSFAFEVPSTVALYQKKPLYQISNILGHEGEGSMLAVLKERGWASGLSAGPNSMDSSRGVMEVRVSLTAEGMEHIETIGELLFRAIRQIRDEGLDRWRFEEQRALAETSFRYSEKPDAMSLVLAIADRLHDYPWQEVLSAAYTFEQFDADLLDQFLGYLEPGRVAVTLVAPGLETTSQEQWFRTEYALESLDPKWLTAWQDPGQFAELALPDPNPFVPEQLDMVSGVEGGDRPVAIVDQDGLTLWHHTDTSFSTPRAVFYFSFRSPLATASPLNAALSDLFTRVIEDRLNTFSYPASLAGLGYEVYPHLRGFSVRVSGFSDRQGKLLERIADSLRSGEFSVQRFNRLRANLVDNYRNRLLDSPSRLAVSELQRLLVDDAWPIQPRIDALAEVTFEDFKAFTNAFLAHGNILALSAGNRLEAESIEMANILRGTLLKDMDVVHVPRSSIVRLEPGRHYERVIVSAHSDSVVGLYTQGVSDSYTERALFYLYDQLSNSDFYNQLRTQQNLGYIVQSFAMPVIRIPGMMYLVQSPSTAAAQTEAAIRAFIGSFGERMKTLEPGALDAARDALLSRINQRDEALTDRTDRYWRELDDEELGFDSRERLSEALKAITIEDMREFAKRLTGPSTGSLVVRADGRIPPGEVETGIQVSRSEITDPAAFKEDHAVF